ncbi:hypothetical protein C900_04245 [Fulvivirga imtechensis AK7]|uniref:Uncharacterized protein n=1 Tax=Fulvivirga imtechensis AK7 TaxID=1237149 RepID=L8JYZ4_9BACT|nr:hypothetical protein [Fulvivirga imtechensis]ELR73393.1 hypothetical protein C900_04245 [Fulvivirga imtechensis AK7]
MIRKRKLMKGMAVFLAVHTIFSAVAPTVSYALTAGPTAPEATSFEPVDTTDMVNLASGDLAYNIPLLEVPGPSGGYPLSLSYHAGIQTNEDASWTGLGWSVNPGAITRNVNGYADDHFHVNNTSRFYWEGGERKTHSVGVSVGIPGTPASMNGGVSFSHDTYLGMGFGVRLGAGASLANSPFDVGVTVGTSPYGGSYASAGIGVGIRSSENSTASLSAGLSVSTNFESVNVGGTAGVNVMGTSISTGSGVKPSLSVGGASISRHNSKSGNLSQNAWGLTVPIPVFYGVWLNLGYNYRRYWIDETENLYTNGALYYPNFETDKSWLDTRDYDTYSLLDPTLEGGIIENADANEVLGGSLVNYDDYFVHAQGVVGGMRPYLFKRHLLKRNKFDIKDFDDDNATERRDYMVSYPLGYNEEKVEFRFINDFSNRHLYRSSEIINKQNTADPLDYNFDGEVKTGEKGDDGYKENHLAGSKNIRWFTHRQITDKEQEVLDNGFIETSSPGFKRGDWPDDQIGGFIITNESGIKYHFSLPAASYGEYMRSQNITREDGRTFNEFKKPERYAYTWYLTAITGPDFVDRGPSGEPDGILNEYDWGYWVAFDYGLWSDNYQWRTPSIGTHRDLDQNFENYSYGKKEVYYLNKIYTKSHTAFFVKEIRADGKGVVNRNGGHYKLRSSEYDQCRDDCELDCDRDGYEDCQCDSRCEGLSDEMQIDLPVSTLRLDKILLCKNSELNGIDQVEAKAQNYNYQSSLVHHFGDNVLDVHDEENIQLTERSLRSIVFTHDYSLAPQTSNSFDPNGDNYLDGSRNTYLKGKLTLKGLQFNGKSGVSLVPPMSFEYDIDESGTADLSGEIVVDKSHILSEGDIIKFGHQNKTYYAVITRYESTISDPRFRLKYLNGSPTTSFIENVSISKTKNPPYNQEQYDIWGLYKPDVDIDVVEQDENLGRMVSFVSSKASDAWSLRGINTSMGSSISLSYESDTYKQSPLYKAYNLKVTELEPLSSGQVKVHLGQSAIDLSKIKYIDILGVVAYPYVDGWYYDNLSCGNTGFYSFDSDLFDFKNEEVIDAGVDFITIKNPQLYNIITLDKGTVQESGPGHPDCGNEYHEVDYSGDVDLLGANISFRTDLNNAGGGLRVKKIAINSLIDSHSTIYDYRNGVTSFEPYKMGQYLDLSFPKNDYYNDDRLVDYQKKKSDLNKQYQKLVWGTFEELLANAAEAPAPGIVYQEVEVSEVANGVEIPNSTVYSFEVFNKGMVGIDYSNEELTALEGILDGDETREIPPYDTVRTRHVTVKDYTTRVGNLKTITLYDAGNNKVSETINHYLSDGIEEELLAQGYEGDNQLYDANKEVYESKLDAYKQQGVVHENFSEARFLRQEYKKQVKYDNLPFAFKTNAYHLLGVVTQKEEYPSIQIGQTNINYKTGIVTSSENLAFDFYSGQVVKILTKDSYGNYYMTEEQPAYRKYEAMGLAIYGGKNMLIQSAGRNMFKVERANHKPIGLVSATVQTWSNGIKVVEEIGENDIWRKQASFVWNGDWPSNPDGTYPVDHFVSNSFNYENLSSNIEWEKQAEITLYDMNSHSLEATDINNNYAAVRMDPLYEKVLISVANGSYDEIGYSGAENLSFSTKEGGVNSGEGIATTARSHTGKYSLQVAFNTEGFNYHLGQSADLSKMYKASVWVYMPGESETDDQISKIQLYYKVNGQEYISHPNVNKNKSKNWYLLEAIIDPKGADEVYIGCRNLSSRSVYFDDFRVNPVSAVVTSYVYDPVTGELSYILDQNNFYTHFEYDALGRLVRTSREMLNFDFGQGKESFKADKTLSEIIYNYGEKE